jgi:LPXTG-motif cell wall-anchored protein
MTPVPDLKQTQTLFGVLLLAVAAVIAIRRKKFEQIRLPQSAR